MSYSIHGPAPKKKHRCNGDINAYLQTRTLGSCWSCETRNDFQCGSGQEYLMLSTLFCGEHGWTTKEFLCWLQLQTTPKTTTSNPNKSLLSKTKPQSEVVASADSLPGRDSFSPYVMIIPNQTQTYLEPYVRQIYIHHRANVFYPIPNIICLRYQSKSNGWSQVDKSIET